MLDGVYRTGAPPTVMVPGGLQLAVAFAARTGERVRLVLEAESVLVARTRVATSARNVLTGTVERIFRTGPGTGGAQRLMTVRIGPIVLPVALTTSAIRSLRLAPRRRVYLYVKATALHRR